jgi:squalene synthase HpnC
MSVDHYENFPVASLLLPGPLRQPVAVLYRFARNADDFADEGERSPAERLALLEGYRQQLRHLDATDGAATAAPSLSAPLAAPGAAPGATPGITPGIAPAPDAALFQALAQLVRQYQLPLQALHDLLDAFSQDVSTDRYPDFATLLHYCQRSAAPVGRLMLQLFRHTGIGMDDRSLQRSDDICCALQLINFWQDIASDLQQRNRIYLPQDDLQRFGVSEAQLRAGDCGGGFRALMAFQVGRSRQMMLAGAPLAPSLPGRIGLEIRSVVQGGLRILEKIERVDYDIFRHRPVLGALDWPVLLWRALRMAQA